eukprot:CAMPEP_0194309378 /NCGR_PEP_ID=MMETSP0171-20130528/6346_1 /TAXON_ID=218684 /ORGANISM="Corethron pennatum, Strain L29A3" /LENGTH=96 /DNA_ID=CAMNT_0039062511 /DNA_START=495 /DNA_END=785 /DNA_ORIENTATION=-
MVFQPDAAEASLCGDVPLALHLALLLQVLLVSKVVAAHCTTTTITITTPAVLWPLLKRQFSTRKIEHLPSHPAHLVLNFCRHHVPSNISYVDLCWL